MRRDFHIVMVWPIVTFGFILAVGCLFSIWYIQYLQSDLSQTITHDVNRLQTVQDLKVQLRALRLHTVLCAANPNEENRLRVFQEEQRFSEQITAFEKLTDLDQDLKQIRIIREGFEKYEDHLGPSGMPDSRIQSIHELVEWSNDHPVKALIAPCDELIEFHDARMQETLRKSEEQTAWAGSVLIGLGIIGSLGGLLSGYALARGLSRTVAQLSVRVRAVQAHLDQEIGEFQFESPKHLVGIDQQLEQVVNRVREVCLRLQEQERDLLRAEQLAAVGQLAAGVAHEIRNPLTGMKLLIEAALRSHHPTNLSRDELIMIRAEIARVERTVQGLLDFARAPLPHRADQDIGKLLEQAIELSRSRAERQQVQMQSRIADARLKSAVDSDQFLSMVTNLIFNALEATPAGGLVLIDANRESNRQISISIKDTGIGISEDIANRLFTPFATTKTTGTGLGLSVALRIARDHGGDLRAANRPEGGACFTILLPSSGAD